MLAYAAYLELLPVPVDDAQELDCWRVAFHVDLNNVALVHRLRKTFTIEGFYFSGTSFKMATRNSQNSLTVEISTFSSGLCGKRMVGPKEIMSRWG